MTGYVEIELDGMVYQGEYHVDDGIVTVYGHTGSEFTKIGGSEPSSLAKILLRRLAQRGDIEPEANKS